MLIPLTLYMRFTWCAAIGILILSLGLSAQAAPRKTLRGHVPSAVSRLTPNGRYAATNRLELAIGLPLRNQAELDELIGQLYDPTSPNYHKYLTPQEYTERFGPTEQDYHAVIAFLEANGFTVTDKHSNRVLLDVEGSTQDIERTFQTTLRTYRHPKEDRDFVAPDREPSVPAGLSVVDISGLSDFGRPRALVHRSKETLKALAGSGPSGLYAGNDFRNAYAPGTTLTGAGQTVGLLQFDGYNQSDIVAYQNTIGRTSYVTLQNVLLDKFKGGAGSGNIEVCLDIETVLSMAPGLTKIIVYEGNPSFPFFNPVDVLNRMATDNLAKQLSSSWTWNGGPSISVDAALKQMAVQGQSYFQASGDSDAYTGSQLLDVTSEINIPVASTNVTAVGGTSLTMNGAGGSYASEVVWNWNSLGGQDANVGSGGGVSTFYSIPPWQAGVSMTANLGSTTMRNVPDVALTADDVYVVYTENNASASGGVGGTSCAAPLWAGFTALINQQSVTSSGTTVGFVNPAIYALGATTNYTNCFHDTVIGDNIGTNTPGLYTAVPGYDLCTGWGSPNGTNLINALAPRPYFLSQPISQTVGSGTNVIFSIALGGQPPFNYRWTLNGTNVVDGGTISGANSSVLSLSSVIAAEAGNYRVVVTNTSGAVTSSIAVLTVTSPATNHSPVLASISNKTVNELTVLSFTNSATDSDGNALTFSLDPGAPSGASITTNGVFSWTPSEVQGPATNSVTVRVIDNGSPALSDTKSFSITVNEVNVAPTLTAITNRTVNEGATLTFTNSAADSDLPANTITYSLGTNAPAGASINSGTGVLTWTPTEAQGPGVYSISVIATDNGSPVLSDTKTFSVTVNEVNTAPTLAVVTNRTVNEGVTLTITNSAADTDVPMNSITYSLGTNAPAGAIVNPASGVFTWTPTEGQGPGVYSITIIASDNGSPVLSSTNSFSVTVNEVNVAPVLAAIATRTVHAGSLVLITNSATDADVPTNTLTFSLTNAPVGMSINSSNGIVAWTPTDVNIGTTNTFVVQVVDDGSPILADSKIGTVAVLPPPAFQVTAVSNGIVTLAWSSIANQTYRVQFKNDLTDANWIDLGAVIIASGSTATATDSLGGNERFYRIVLP